MVENIDWYSGEDILILSVEQKGEITFNTAFSNELKRNVNKESMTVYPKVAFAMHEGCLLIKIMDNEGFMVLRNFAYGNAVLASSESYAVRERFGSEILGEWKFEKINGYYKGIRINNENIEPCTLTAVK